MISYGQIAYEAYCESVGWSSVGGEPLRTWQELMAENRKVAEAWEYAAEAVLDHVQ